MGISWGYIPIKTWNITGKLICLGGVLNMNMEAIGSSHPMQALGIHFLTRSHNKINKEPTLVTNRIGTKQVFPQTAASHNTVLASTSQTQVSRIWSCLVKTIFTFYISLPWLDLSNCRRVLRKCGPDRLLGTVLPNHHGHQCGGEF